MSRYTSLLFVHIKYRTNERATASSRPRARAPAETIIHRREREFIIAPPNPPGRDSPLLSDRARAVHRRRSRWNTKTTTTTIYDCRRSRGELISPDFTSAPEQPTQPPLGPARSFFSLLPVLSLPTVSSSISFRLGRDGRKSRATTLPALP